jgi:RNA polymerase sigma-70 factor (ECF subfamily)
MGPTASNDIPGEAALRFREQLEDCLPALQARALKLCLDSGQARDLVQDTVERALRFEASYRPGTNQRAWMQQVLFTVFVTRCRKYKRERRALDAFASDPNSWTHKSPRSERADLSPRVNRALGELPEKFQSVLKLVDIDELSYREAATVLKVPIGTVMSRLFRGRRQLAVLLADSVTPVRSEMNTRQAA